MSNSAAVAKANALLAEALKLIAQARELLPVDDGDLASAMASLVDEDTPLRIDDLFEPAFRDAIGDLPDVFDTWHVIEHSAFQKAHAAYLERPAINQLAGKYLRKYSAALGVELVDDRGRKRSARWRKV